MREFEFITINDDVCIKCGVCEGTCPVSALTLEDVVEMAEGACIGCGECTGACPVGAITLK